MDTETKLDQILKIVTIIQQDLETMKRDFQELKEQDVAQLKKDVVELKERVTKLEERMVKLEGRMTKLENRMTKLEDRMTKIENSVFLIETGHGDKLRALFDAREANENKHEEIINLCLSIKSEFQGTLFNHEKRISKLEGNLVPSF